MYRVNGWIARGELEDFVRVFLLGEAPEGLRGVATGGSRFDRNPSERWLVLRCPRGAQRGAQEDVCGSGPRRLDRPDPRGITQYLYPDIDISPALGKGRTMDHVARS